MYDWNGNGEHDAFDDYINYELINEDHKETGRSKRGGRNSSGSVYILFILIALSVEAGFHGAGIFIFLGLCLIKALYK